MKRQKTVKLLQKQHQGIVLGTFLQHSKASFRSQEFSIGTQKTCISVLQNFHDGLLLHGQKGGQLICNLDFAIETSHDSEPLQHVWDNHYLSAGNLCLT